MSRPEGGVDHPERFQNSGIHKLSKFDASDTLRNLGCKQDGHARVLVFCTRLKVQWDLHRAVHKRRKWRMTLSQVRVLRQLIGKPGYMGEQMPNCHAIFCVPLEFRNVFPDRIIQTNLSLIDQRHDGCHSDRLGNRSQQKCSIDGLRVTERLMKYFLSNTSVQDRRPHLPARRCVL